MMHCKDWEERVALHVGGDLAAADAVVVERHLAECAGCQVFWSGMKASLELLQEAHAEGVAPGYITAVRGRVMANLHADMEAGRRTWWRRRWVYGLAAAMVIAVGLASWPGPKVEMPAVRVAAVIPPALATASRGLRPSLARGLPHRAHVAGHVAKPRVVRPRQVETMPREPLLVRLVTDDPNVIIYWIAE